MDLRKHLKFKVSKGSLLFEAAVVWTFAGMMLLTRGELMLEASSGFSWLKIIPCICCGVLFFVLLFSKISRKHINRIKNLFGDKHPVYEFFNFKSYMMMAGMITLGIVLRKTLIIPLSSLALVYITMGIPLLFSSIRFYINWFNHLLAANKTVN